MNNTQNQKIAQVTDKTLIVGVNRVNHFFCVNPDQRLTVNLNS